jgi:hypothetical protein
MVTSHDEGHIETPALEYAQEHLREAHRHLRDGTVAAFCSTVEEALLVFLTTKVEGVSRAGVDRETLERLGKRSVVREYLSLASKVSALRLERNPAELEGSEEYQRLAERLRELETEVDEGERVETPRDV